MQLDARWGTDGWPRLPIATANLANVRNGFYMKIVGQKESYRAGGLLLDRLCKGGVTLTSWPFNDGGSQTATGGSRDPVAKTAPKGGSSHGARGHGHEREEGPKLWPLHHSIEGVKARGSCMSQWISIRDCGGWSGATAEKMAAPSGRCMDGGIAGSGGGAMRGPRGPGDLYGVPHV